MDGWVGVCGWRGCVGGGGLLGLCAVVRVSVLLVLLGFLNVLNLLLFAAIYGALTENEEALADINAELDRISDLVERPA